MIDVKNRHQDLWGDLDLSKADNGPRKILEEQAALLSKKTNGLLKAKINTFTLAPLREGKLKYTVYHSFHVQAADTGMELFRAVRALKPSSSENPYYPVEITWNGGSIQKIQTEEEFIEQVRYVLQHEKTTHPHHRYRALYLMAQSSGKIQSNGHTG